MQLICYRLGMGLPVVVAGDNLNIPLLGSFLQHAGIIYLYFVLSIGDYETNLIHL
jgi:glycerol-3-phosphate O-acyltransferase